MTRMQIANRFNFEISFVYLWPILIKLVNEKSFTSKCAEKCHFPAEGPLDEGMDEGDPNLPAVEGPQDRRLVMTYLDPHHHSIVSIIINNFIYFSLRKIYCFLLTSGLMNLQYQILSTLLTLLTRQCFTPDQIDAE
jgi:hypothetical protein